MHFPTRTHATLLARLAGGAGADASAWGEFVERYGELIRGFVRRQGLQPADCDDILQDVLVALTRALPGFQYDPSRGRFRSYLKTIALRAMFRRRAERGGEVHLADLEDATRAADRDQAVEQAWEHEWQQYHARIAMRAIESEFNAGDRRAFQRYAVEGADARVVADELGITLDQVYQAKSRILRRLAELIEQQIAEEGLTGARQRPKPGAAPVRRSEANGRRASRIPCPASRTGIDRKRRCWRGCGQPAAHLACPTFPATTTCASWAAAGRASSTEPSNAPRADPSP